MKKLPLTKGKFAIIDEEDFERVAQFKWQAHLTSRGTKWYATRRARVSEKERWKSQRVRLHHFVLDVSPTELALLGPDIVVDHENDDGLDCRKKNLIVCTQAENMARVKSWKRKRSEEPWL